MPNWNVVVKENDDDTMSTSRSRQTVKIKAEVKYSGDFGAVINVPLPRRNHTANKFGTKMVIIGGWSGKENYGSELYDVKFLETNFVVSHPSTYAPDIQYALKLLFDRPEFADVTFLVEEKKNFCEQGDNYCEMPKI